MNSASKPERILSGSPDHKRLGTKLCDLGFAIFSQASVRFAATAFANANGGQNEASPKRIIVFQLYDTLGDVICTSAFYRELARSFPDAKITVAVSADGIPGLMEQNPYISDLVPVNTRCRRWLRPFVLPWRHWQLARRVLRQRSFDIAIIPRYGIDFCYATFLSYFCGAPMRIGYTENTSRRKSIVNHGFDRLLTTVLTPLPSETNEVRSILHVLSALNRTAMSDRTEMWITSQDRHFASRMLGGAGTPRVCLSPTSGHSDLKQWGAARFAELAGELARHGCTIVLLGSKQDIALTDEVEKRCARACINLTGQTTIRQMASIASMCDLFIGNDAGPAHAASAMGVPTLTVFGSSCHHQFAPWGERNRVITREFVCSPCRTGHQADRCSRCICGTPQCLESISVEEVLEAAFSMLESSGAQLRDALLGNCK